MYGFEMAVLTKRQEVVELLSLRVNRMDKIRNEYMRGKAEEE